MICGASGTISMIYIAKVTVCAIIEAVEFFENKQANLGEIQITKGINSQLLEQWKGMS